MFWPSLPSIYMLVISVAAIAICWHCNLTTWITGALFGFVWASSVGHWYSSWQLPNQYFNENVIIEGTIQSLQIQPNRIAQSNAFKNTKVYRKQQVNPNNQAPFILQVSQIGKSSLLHRPNIRLSWFAPNIVLQQGNKVRLLVKIKRPHSLANEFGFNRQKWLASQNIVAVGNVKSSPSNQVIAKHTSLRQQTVNKLLAHGQQLQLDNFRWILALALGERSLFEKEDWKLLQMTGTAHLFAISGLHLGIVSLLFYSLAKTLLFMLGHIVGKDSSQYNLMPLAFLLSLPFCVFYAYISGFQIPVIRATIAICLLSYLVVFQVYWRLLAILLHLIVCFFLLFPLSILSISFWFSFGAVFAIWFFAWRFPRKVNTSLQTLKQGIGLQLFLSVVMLPLVAFNFSIVSIVSPIVNIIVLPVVSLILVPLCLLLVVSVIFDITFLLVELVTGIDWFFGKLIAFMQVFQSIEYTTLELTYFSFVQSSLILILLALVLLPYWPNRKLLISLLALAITLNVAPYIAFESDASSNPSNPDNSKELEHQDWTLRVFDIGQGLSVLIRQGDEFLLYDTGPSFVSGGSLARIVLKPYFAANKQSKTSVASIKYLVNSHMDNDHAGGNAFIFKHYNVVTWLTPAKGCTANDSFVWGNLSLTVLWPLKNRSGDENNDSCVIKISDGTNSLLLTGDIEKSVEKALIKSYLDTGILKADVMLSPHHGSKTSSTLAFVRAVAPKYLAISSQYYNQWRFPHSSVLSNYNDVQAEVFNTAYDGEVTFVFTKDGIEANAYRRQLLSPWYMQVK
ncbi:MAG: competence protein ComEC [Glaciecola sp.]|jgi:competence protein ComEC